MRGSGSAMGVLAYGGLTFTGYGTIDWIATSIGDRPCYTANANPCG